MTKARSDGTRRHGRLARALCAGFVTMGLSLSLVAADTGPGASICQSTAKSLYYDGFGYTFLHRANLPNPNLEVSQIGWNNGWARNWTLVLTSEAIDGALGTCVYKGLLYVFFTTPGGALQYVTVDPSTRKPAGPTTIATGVAPSGAAAAVFGDAIYVLGAPGSGFVSKDGKSFTTWSPRFSQKPPSQMLAAVTFYPLGDDPAGIMFLYNDGSNPPNLRSCVVDPSGTATVTREVVLPWPPSSPAAWKPVLDGSLLLGTSAGLPGPGAKAGAIQFYGVTDYGADGEHQGRWEYDLSKAAWTFHDMTQTSVACYLSAFPWFDTIDPTKGTMRMSHIVEIYSGLVPGDQFFTNRSDWMVPQNNDPTYGWAGTPTATANAAGTELQKLWTLVGVVLGPPPFPLNGAANACEAADDALAWVDYGKDMSTTVTTTSTSSSTISVASESKIKGGLAEWSLDLAYAHAWTHSNGTSRTVSVSQEFQFGPCSEQPGSQGTHGWAIFNAPTVVTQRYKLYAYDYDPAANQGTYLDQDIYATTLGATVQQTAYFELTDPSQGEYPGLFAGMKSFPASVDVPGWHLPDPGWDDGGSSWTAVFGDASSPQMPVLTLGVRNQVSYTKSATTLSSKGNSNSFDAAAGYKIKFAGFSEGVTMGYSGEWTTQTDTESTITENVSCALNVPIPPYTTGYVNSMTVQPFWLQALTEKAPWVPPGYGGNLPWCIAWDVTQFGTVNAGLAGRVSAPSSASGTIRHGGAKERNRYSVVDGRLAWPNGAGTETAIPTTAKTFDPSKGASVSLNGHVFSTKVSHGYWFRHGDVWSYRMDFPGRSRPCSEGGSAADRCAADEFSLSLDFARARWSFSGTSRTLDKEILTADASVRCVLVVEGRHAFSGRLRHDLDVRWSHEEEAPASQPAAVDEAEGEFSSRTGRGNLALSGHVPHDQADFGDVEIRVHGVGVSFPLLSTPGFLDKLRNRGQVSYRAEGLTFWVDFGSGRWRATIDRQRFRSEMAPREGKLHVQLLVGGKSLVDQTLVLTKWTTALRNPSH